MIQLSVKQRKILSEMELNSRISLSWIARAVGLSKEVVNYNLKKLEEQGIIKGYYTLIDTNKLGYSTFRILLSFKDLSESVEKKLIEKLKKIPNVGWIVFIEGEWNLVLLLWAKNLCEFKGYYEKIQSICGKKIKSKLVSPVFSIHHLKHRLIYEKKDASEITFSIGPQQRVDIDKLDLEILGILSKNSRTPLIDISEKCKTNPKVISYRIKNLEKKGVIRGYFLNLDFSLLGYSHFKVLLNLNSFDKEKIKELTNYIKHNENVIYMTESFGLADVEFEALFKTSKELNSFIKEIVREFPDLIKDHKVILTYSENQVRYFPFSG